MRKIQNQSIAESSLSAVSAFNPPDIDHNEIPSIQDGTQGPEQVPAFSKMKSWKPEPRKEADLFDQLGAEDDYAMEGPIMEGFGDYMTLKRAKIRKQYLESEDLGSQDKKASRILFSGLTGFISTSIYLEHNNDLSTQRKRTVIDFKYLARLWILHGGVLTQNVNNGQLTHFVNSFLPIYFLRDIDKIRSKMRLVNPQWILDCVEQNKRLPTFSYDLQVVTATGVTSNNQTKIPFTPSSTKNSLASSRNNLTSKDSPQNSVTQDRSIRDSEHPVNLVEEEDHDEGEETFQDYELDLVDQNDEPPGPQRMRTSAENPNFVADYFASSRLHHLASWKMKFQEELELHLLSKTNGLSNEIQSKAPLKGTLKEAAKHRTTPLSQMNGGTPEDALNEEIHEPFIVHIDMDAFFASVATRHSPELQRKPVAVSHGGNRALCASVNYAARKLGIKNGGRLLEAQQKCKAAGEELVVVGYDFADYELVSRQVHEIFLQHTPNVHIKSCDEAILDFTDQFNSIEEVKSAVDNIRRSVFETTQCTCSAGIGSTLTLARFALKVAKPNGVAVAPSWHSLDSRSLRLGHFNVNSTSSLSAQITRLLTLLRTKAISNEEYQQSILNLFSHSQFPTATSSELLPVAHTDLRKNEENLNPMTFLEPFKLSDLPGVGWRTKPKFGDMQTVGDVQKCTLQQLQQLLGGKIGVNIFLASRGLDSRLLQRTSERKSVSVDLSYGVRFDNYQQVKNFIKDVCELLQKRCQKANLAGSTATVKLWVRHPDAKPTTFLGHGWCNTFTKTSQLLRPTSDAATLATTAEKLVKSFNIEPHELRGFGLQLSHLSDPRFHSHSITTMFKSAIAKQSLGPASVPLQQALQQGLDASSDEPTPHSSSSNVQTITGSETSHLMPAIVQEDGKVETGKKRLRTIDALMEKQLAKANKKQKQREVMVETHVSRDLHVSPSPRKERPTFLSCSEQPNTPTSSRVIAYSKIDPQFIAQLSDWMKAIESPAPVHCELLHQFVLTLLSERNLEDLRAFGMTLIKLASYKLSWIPVMNDLLTLIQCTVEANFGHRMALAKLPTTSSP